MSSASSEPSRAQARTPLGSDLIVPALGCALTIYYLASTTDLVWEARATGTVIGLALLALCVALFVKFGMRIARGEASLTPGDLFKDDAFNRQRLGLIAMMAVYIVTIPWVGATVGLFFLLIGCMRLLGVTSIRTLLSVALAAALCVHLTLITLLDSKLPRGVIIDQFAPTPKSETAVKKK